MKARAESISEWKIGRHYRIGFSWALFAVLAIFMSAALRAADAVAEGTWSTLKIGAGGYLTGLDVAPDGVMVVRTDTYGAYLWNGSQWQPLITSSSMPASFLVPGLNAHGCL